MVVVLPDPLTPTTSSTAGDPSRLRARGLEPICFCSAAFRWVSACSGERRCAPAASRRRPWTTRSVKGTPTSAAINAASRSSQNAASSAGRPKTSLRSATYACRPDSRLFEKRFQKPGFSVVSGSAGITRQPTHCAQPPGPGRPAGGGRTRCARCRARRGSPHRAPRPAPSLSGCGSRSGIAGRRPGV